jgi:hypothetical protein
MSDPAGLLFKCHISETKLTQFFKTKIADGNNKITIGHAFCKLMDQTNADDDVLILNYDTKEKSFFFSNDL